MSLRIIVTIAISAIVGIACTATFSTDAFARSADMTRLHHGKTHHKTVHSGRAVNHPSMGSKGAAQAAH